MTDYADKIKTLSAQLFAQPKPDGWMGDWPPAELPLGTKFRRTDAKHLQVVAEIPVSPSKFDVEEGRYVQYYHDPIILSEGTLDRSLVLERAPKALEEPKLCLVSVFPNPLELNVIYFMLVDGVVRCTYQDVNEPRVVEINDAEALKCLQEKLSKLPKDDVSAPFSVEFEKEDGFTVVKALQENKVIERKQDLMAIPNIEKICGKGFYALVHGGRYLRKVKKDAEGHHADSRVKEADYVVQYNEGDWVACSKSYEPVVYKSWDEKIDICIVEGLLPEKAKFVEAGLYLSLQKGKIFYQTHLMLSPEELEKESFSRFDDLLKGIRKSKNKQTLAISKECKEALLERASSKKQIKKRASKAFEPKEEGTFEHLLKRKDLPEKKKQQQSRDILKKYGAYLNSLKKSNLVFTDGKPENISIKGRALDHKSIRKMKDYKGCYYTSYSFRNYTDQSVKNFLTINAYRPKYKNGTRYDINKSIPLENHDQIYGFLHLLEYAGLCTNQTDLVVLGQQSEALFKHEYNAGAFPRLDVLFDSTVRWLDIYEKIPEDKRKDLTENFVAIPLEKRQEYCDDLLGFTNEKCQSYCDVVDLLNKELKNSPFSIAERNICAEVVWRLFKNDFFMNLEQTDKKTTGIQNIVGTVTKKQRARLGWIQAFNDYQDLAFTQDFWENLLTKPLTPAMNDLLICGIQEYRKREDGEKAKYCQMFEHICTAVWDLEEQKRNAIVPFINILIKHNIFEDCGLNEIKKGITNLVEEEVRPLLTCFIDATNDFIVQNKPKDKKAQTLLKTVLLAERAEEKKVWKAFYNDTSSAAIKETGYVKELSKQLHNKAEATNALYKKHASWYYCLTTSGKSKEAEKEKKLEARYQTLIRNNSSDPCIKFAQAFLKQAMNYLNRKQGGFFARRYVRQAVVTVMDECLNANGTVKDTVQFDHLTSAVKKRIGGKKTSKRGMFFEKAVQEARQAEEAEAPKDVQRIPSTS